MRGRARHLHRLSRKIGRPYMYIYTYMEYVCAGVNVCACDAYETCVLAGYEKRQKRGEQVEGREWNGRRTAPSAVAVCGVYSAVIAVFICLFHLPGQVTADVWSSVHCTIVCLYSFA